MYQWCGFKSRRGKNKNCTALKSNSNTVWFNFQTYRYIYIYIYIKLSGWGDFIAPVQTQKVDDILIRQRLTHHIIFLLSLFAKTTRLCLAFQTDVYLERRTQCDEFSINQVPDATHHTNKMQNCTNIKISHVVYKTRHDWNNISVLRVLIKS